MKRVIALACADEPLALSDSLPPQSPAGAAVPPSPDPEEAVLLSLPHADNSSVPAASRLGHADIALAAALRFVNDAHPGLLPMAQLPTLAAHAARLEALPVFQAVSQPFIPPTS